eukprot:6209154-Pleurochrysis_carterae.AAC.1
MGAAEPFQLGISDANRIVSCMRTAHVAITLLLLMGLVAVTAKLPNHAQTAREDGQGLTVDRSGKPHVTLHPPQTKYWKTRTRPGVVLYHRTLALARQYAPKALTVLDVGAHDPSYISQLNWIPAKVATDIQFNKDQAHIWGQTQGVVFMKGDFLKLEFATKYDLVTCQQVVEHLPPGVVELFVQKMMSIARTLIVSTTLELPFGVIGGHVQDPISESKFRSWFNGSNGRIIKYETVRGGNPKANYTLPGPARVGRVAVRNQIVVWVANSPVADALQE